MSGTHATLWRGAAINKTLSTQSDASGALPELKVSSLALIGLEYVSSHYRHGQKSCMRITGVEGLSSDLGLHVAVEAWTRSPTSWVGHIETTVNTDVRLYTGNSPDAILDDGRAVPLPSHGSRDY